MASYAAELRRRLAAESLRDSQTGGDHRERLAEISGLVDAAGKGTRSGLELDVSSAPVARSAVRLLRAQFGVEPELIGHGASPGSFGRARYVVRIGGNRALQATEEMSAVRATLDAGARSGRANAYRANAYRASAYLRGAFQGAGSVTPPGYRKGHHLEFSHTEEGFVRRVAALCREPLSVARRRKSWVAYTKSSDGVTTVLAQLGLQGAILEYEARAVLGEAKANANRVTNFDAANAGRVAISAARQQEALESLDPERLSGALREMRDLRLQNPHASLAELARLGGITKSAANHRLRRLLSIGG